MEALPLRHILVSVDESKASFKAFEWALTNLYKQGDTLHLFHVIPTGQHVVMNMELGVDEIVEDDATTQIHVENHAKDYLTSTFVPPLEEKKVPYQIEIVKFAVDTESIGSVICKRADQLNAAAVVMAKHNKGQIQEFFVGSVTNHCTRHCRSPVLIIHAD